MLAAEAGGTEIGQLTTGGGGAWELIQTRLLPWGLFFPLWLTLLSKEVASEENTDPVQNLAAWRPPPPCPLSFSFEFSMKYFHMQKGLKNKINQAVFISHFKSAGMSF